MEKRGTEEGERDRGLKMVFWNVAGMTNKDKDFWEGLKRWDVIMLEETWLGAREWEKIRGNLPKGYIWGRQEAERRNRKGRAMGGMLMRIRRELMEKGSKIEMVGQNIMVGKVMRGEE